MSASRSDPQFKQRVIITLFYFTSMLCSGKPRVNSASANLSSQFGLIVSWMRLQKSPRDYLVFPFLCCNLLPLDLPQEV